jgi:DNA-binding CsgD family transcriptional regulator
MMASTAMLEPGRIEGLARLPERDLEDVIAVLGEQDFPAHLLHYLNCMVRADQVEIMRLKDGRLENFGAKSLGGDGNAVDELNLYIAQYWQLDPLIRAACEKIDARPTIGRMEVGQLAPSALRDMLYCRRGVCDRLIVHGPGIGGDVIVSASRFKRNGAFGELDIARLKMAASAVLSVAAKHVSLVSREQELPYALSSLAAIQDCMSQAGDTLTPREVEVCARILHGISSLGIALELDIGEETVKTYRKRAYARLGIGTQRELLIWYLQRWRSLSGGARLGAGHARHVTSPVTFSVC